MTKTYETLVIVNSTGTDAELSRTVAQVEDVIKKVGGAVTQSHSFGRRRLAYRIGQLQEGFYHLATFQMDPAGLEDLKRAFRLSDVVVRFLILHREASPVAAPAASN